MAVSAKWFFRPDGVTRTVPPPPPLRAGAAGDILRPDPPAPGRTGRFPSLSVVLALFGQLPLTRACLESLAADVPEAEVICVDNGSPDETPAWLRGHPEFRTFTLAENRGCAYAWNLGIGKATGDVLCVLNNDTVVLPGGMQALAQAAWVHGIAALRGGRVHPDCTYAGPSLDPRESDYPEGAALAFRRDVWERVGRFAPRYGLGYYEDTDWGVRARLTGYHWVFCPGAITHLGGATAATLPDLEALRERNRQRFLARWGGFGLGERIVVTRGGGLGDVIMATPVLAALRRDYPLARIFLSTLPHRAGYFRGLPGVDGVATGPVPGATREIVLDGAYEARHIAGDWVHAPAAFAERAGVTLDTLTYLAPPTPELDPWAAELLPGAGYVALGLRSEFRPKVNWDEEQWLALVRAHPAWIFLALDPCRRPELQALGSYAGPRLYDEPNVLDLTGETPTPRHLLALLRRCAAAVCVDSGIQHVAASAGLPLVALYGSARPEGIAPRRPDGTVITLPGQAPCYPCTHRSQCPRTDGPHCLASVSGQAAAAALAKVLGG